MMRPVFYDFPTDQESWNVEDAYLFGPDLYVAPVMEDHVTEREVYLPDGTAWFNAWTGEKYEGGQKRNGCCTDGYHSGIRKGRSRYRTSAEHFSE